MKALEWSQHFSHYKSMGIFFKRSGAAYSSVSGPILPNFEPIRHFMVVLVTYKNDEDSIKNIDTRVVTRVFIIFSDAQGQLTQKSVMGS